MKRIADERQGYEISRVEHYAFWTMFWLLVVSIPVQLLLLQDPMMILGECTVVLIVSLFMLVSFVKRGLWGNHTTPSWKTHLLSGLLTAVIGTSVIWANAWGNEHILYYLLISFIGLFLVAFVLSYTLGVIIKKREKKLADENDDPNLD